MRILPSISLLALLIATPAGASWTVTASEGYACVSTQVLKQLRLMSAIPSAFDIALLDKTASGECKSLKQGEAVEVVEDNTLPPSTIKIRRENGEELYAPERFIGQST